MNHVNHFRDVSPQNSVHCNTYDKMCYTYTLRLKANQKEWISKTPNASEQIRKFINSQLTKEFEGKPLDFFEATALMERNREKIELIEDDLLYRRALKVLKSYDDYLRKYTVEMRQAMNGFPFVDIDTGNSKSFKKEEMEAYVNRCRRVAVGFQAKIEEVKTENRVLEDQLFNGCNTISHTCYSVHEKPLPPPEKGSHHSHSSQPEELKKLTETFTVKREKTVTRRAIHTAPKETHETDPPSIEEEGERTFFANSPEEAERLSRQLGSHVPFDTSKAPIEIALENIRRKKEQKNIVSPL